LQKLGTGPALSFDLPLSTELNKFNKMLNPFSSPDGRDNKFICEFLFPYFFPFLFPGRKYCGFDRGS
jgi:hypothetical protein